MTVEHKQLLRAQFPALASGTIFLENAGGSQVPTSVIERMSSYMRESYVQLGAGYERSQRATSVVDTAHEFVRLLMGGADGDVILGPSASGLLQMLANCYAEILSPGQEIVIAEIGHEANVGPWARLEKLGMTIRWWRMDPDSFSSPLEALECLLSEKTALVALPHVSNLLGEVLDLGRVCELAHASGARVVADGVAYAPHRAMAVDDWGVDWYAFSTYKVYGPHMGALWGRDDAMRELAGPNHFFITDTPHRFELGGACHEGCAGLLGLAEYLKLAAGVGADAALDRAGIEDAFAVMETCEQPARALLLEYLRNRDDVRIVGPREDGATRVGTVSFVHASKRSRQIVEEIDCSEIAIRHGHMYAYRLCQAARIEPQDGVVRVSMVHYNTCEEIERLIEVLERALC